MQPEAEAFAENWIEAWNAHDLDVILAHYAPNIEFLSPVAREVTGDGRVVGIPALRAYWTRALVQNPELKFERVEVLAGDRCVTVVYRNHRRQLAAETFEFDECGRVVRAYACYRVEP